MLNMRNLRRGAAAAAFVAVIAFGVLSLAADIVDDWASAKTPAPS